jgi:putative acetyltransferase
LRVGLDPILGHEQHGSRPCVAVSDPAVADGLRRYLGLHKPSTAVQPERLDAAPPRRPAHARATARDRTRVGWRHAREADTLPDRPPSPTIVTATEPCHWTEVRALFREYSDSLDFDLRFQDFERELANVEGIYSPPEGLLLLATVAGRVAGCVAMRRFADSVCEMKRLYLRPALRGSGLGRLLAEAIVDEARRTGYTRMRLDTVPSMREALSLYRSLGFVEIPAYCVNPVPGAIYLELALGDHPPGG